MIALASVEDIVIAANGVVWGIPLFGLLLGVGLLLTIRLGVIQVRRLPLAVRRLFEGGGSKGPVNDGDISPLQALTTALSGTMGIGNIAGVSTAIVTGGPGAMFWMWLVALIGMATKYSEAVLAIRFRSRDKGGAMAGGPMYYIEKGLNNRWLAMAFAFCGVIATIAGAGMPQANSIVHGLESLSGVFPEIPVPWLGDISGMPVLVGLVLVFFTGLVIVGGIRRIGRVTAWLIPAISIVYVGSGLIAMALNADRLPGVMAIIVQSAFSPYAVAGGAVGYTVAEAIRYGVARGVFTNEAGLGSAPVAYAASTARSPVDQGLLAMLEVFIDTILTCSITAFVVLSSGLWDDGLTGTALTIEAFSGTLGWAGAAIVVASTVLFGFSTIIGWSYYGEQYAAYLFGERSKKWFKAAYLISVFLGSLLGVGLVWEIADLFNGLMAVPNLIALAALSGVVALETREYFGKGAVGGSAPPVR